MKKVAFIISLICLLVDPFYDVSADVKSLKGEIIKISRRAGIILLSTEDWIEPVEYGDSTRFINLKDDSSFITGLPLKIRADDSNLVFFANEIEGPPPMTLNNGKEISLEELLNVLKKGSKIYDLRSEIDYLGGRIPGALPTEELINEKDIIIFYCSRSDCAESEIARKIASDNKLKKLFFAGGIDSWKKAKKPLEASLKHLQAIRKEKVPYILIDVRDSNSTSKGFIPGAVSIPSDVIKYSSYRFPAYKKAVIIVYGQDMEDQSSMKAAELISEWGYKNVLRLYDGFEEYQKSGGDISKGEVQEEIDYVIKREAREISKKRFKAYVESLPDNIIVLDVREEDEVKLGRFRNSVNIPLDELQYRLDEIDKTKSVLTHCASGARATIGYYILKKAGFKASCLNAYVGFDDSGVYSISDN
jgi:rhodanese-related sulfurtransferase